MIHQLTPVFNISFQNSNLEAIGVYINELEACDSNIIVHDYYLIKFSRPFIVIVIYSYLGMETKANSIIPKINSNEHRKSSQRAKLCC